MASGPDRDHGTGSDRAPSTGVQGQESPVSLFCKTLLLSWDVKELQRSQQVGVRGIRERLVAMEANHQRMCNSELDLYRTNETIANGRLTSAQASDSQQLLSHARRKSVSLLSKPFGYGEELAYKKLLQLCTQEPNALAYALAQASHKQLLSRVQTDAVARSIVSDLFGQRYRRQLLEVLCRSLVHVKSFQAAHRKKFAIAHGSLLARSMQAFLQAEGSRFLVSVLRPTVERLVKDETLNFDLLGGRSSPDLAGSAKASTDEPGGATGGNLLYMSCGQMVKAVLESLPSLPHSIRVLTAMMAALGAPPPGSEELKDNKKSPSRVPEKVWRTSRVARAGDMIFMSWLVNVLNFPDNYQLTRHFPVSEKARHNLRAVGTVLVKLVSGSRFVAFQQQHLSSLNAFLDELEPRVAEFLEALIAVPLPDWFDEKEGSFVTPPLDTTPQPPRQTIFDPLRPLSLLPSDVFVLHRIFQFAGGQQLDTTAPDPLRSVRPIIAQLPKKPRTVDASNDSYVIFDMDIPDLENILRQASPMQSDMAIDERTARAESLLHTVLETVDSTLLETCSRHESAPLGLDEVLLNQSKACAIHGDRARATVLRELSRHLRSTVPADMQADGFLPLLRSVHSKLQQRLDELNRGDVYRQLLMITNMVDDHIKSLKQRETALQERFRELRIRFVLEHVSTNLPVLKEYMLQRARALHSAYKPGVSATLPPVPWAQQRESPSKRLQSRWAAWTGIAEIPAARTAPRPVTPPPFPSLAARNSAWAACGGACPVDMDADRFMCGRCDERLKTHVRLLAGFLKWSFLSVPKLPQPLLEHLGPPGRTLAQEMTLPDVTSRILDYVADSCHDSVLVQCHAADDMFYQLLQRLQTKYPTLRAFHTALERGHRPEPVSQDQKSETDGDGDHPHPDSSIATTTDPNTTLTEQPIGSDTLESAVRELGRVAKCTSILDKLDAFVKTRTIITAVLQNPHLFAAFNPTGDGPAGGSGHSGSADDYMPILSYVIMVANPVRFISNVEFVQMMYPASLNVKGFVDCLVAIKFLMSMRPPPPPRPPQAAHPPVPPKPVRTLSAASLQAVRERVLAMGFLAEDVTAGMHRLHFAQLQPEDLEQDRGFTRLLDFLTDLACLREMGYTGEAVIDAVLASGHNVSRAVQMLLSQQ